MRALLMHVVLTHSLSWLYSPAIPFHDYVTIYLSSLLLVVIEIIPVLLQKNAAVNVLVQKTYPK